MTTRIKMSDGGPVSVAQTRKTVDQVRKDADFYGLPVTTPGKGAPTNGANYAIIGGDIFIGEPKVKHNTLELLDLYNEAMADPKTALYSHKTGPATVRKLLKDQDPYAVVANLLGCLSQSDDPHGREKGTWLDSARRAVGRK